MTNERSRWRWVGVLGAVGAIPCAVMTSLAGRPSGDLQDAVFGALAVAWCLSPYVVAYACGRTTLRAVWALPIACGVLVYAAMDLIETWQALWRPARTTDAIALLVLPVWSPLVIGSVALVARGLTLFAQRPHTPVCDHRTPGSLSDVR